MTAGRTLLVGGLSSVHDPLCAAALRGLGISAVPLHARTDTGLRRARALGNHGQCNPAHYAAGAVLEHALRSEEDPAAFAERYRWLTVGSCGPCRLAAFGLEYARVLGGAGLGELPVQTVEQLSFVDATIRGGLPRLDSGPARALLLAVVAGDVLTTLGHAIRPYAVDPAGPDQLLEAAVKWLVEAFEQRASLVPPFGRVRLCALAIARDMSRVLPRVVLVGEPWTTLADGDPSYDLARRLGAYGVEVEAPTASDWLRYRLWEEERDALREHNAPQERIAALHHADRRIRALWRQLGRAAGLAATRLVDMDELAELARPYYDPDVRGGSAHLEIGRALLAARGRTAHLVISLKPFGCLPSSDLSDGILSVLAREQRAPRFLPIETTGDADAAVESRVEMAIHAASLAAAEEFEAACAACGLSPSAARRELQTNSGGVMPPSGPRAHACTAAELLRRARSTIVVTQPI